MVCGSAMPVMAQHETNAATRFTIVSEPVPTATPTGTVVEATETPSTTTPSAFCDVARDTSSDSTLGEIRGRVTNGTLGSEVPEGLLVNLFGINDQQVVVTDTVEVSSGGEFVFEDVLIVEGWLFFVAAEHQGVLYYSATSELPSAGGILELPLEIYDATDRDEFIRVEQLHILFDFSSQEIVAVLEVWILSNLGDRSYVSNESGIEIMLPEGAQGLQIEKGDLQDRFLLTESGFIDTAAVLPGIGAHELIITYEIPHAARLDFSQPLGYAVLGVEIMLPEEGPVVLGGELQDNGVRQVSTGTLHTYTTGPFEPGETLTFSIAEDPSAAGTAEGIESLTGLVIGAGMLGVALVAVGFAWRRASKRKVLESTLQRTDDILRTIADIDDARAMGWIAEDDYHRRREELKQQALKQMRAEDD
jgi:hypothetical protein